MVGQSAKAIKQQIRTLVANPTALNDGALDRMLKIAPHRTEKRLDRLALLERYGNEQFEGDGLSYQEIRTVISGLRIKDTDIVYDLGSGYGRFLILGAIISKAQFRGIEIVSERAELSVCARQRLHLRNLEIKNCNILDADFSDGTKFYLYNPFFKKTLVEVVGRLKNCAKQRPIKVAALFNSASALARENWLKETKTEIANMVLGLRFFQSQV